MTPLNLKCKFCPSIVSVEVHHSDMEKWNHGMHIQDAMPYLTADEREMFISGICPKCWDRMMESVSEE